MMDDSLSMCTHTGAGSRISRGKSPQDRRWQNTTTAPKSLNKNCDSFAVCCVRAVPTRHHERRKDNSSSKAFWCVFLSLSESSLSHRVFVLFTSHVSTTTTTVSSLTLGAVYRERLFNSLFHLCQHTAAQATGDEDDLRPQTWLTSICPRLHRLDSTRLDSFYKEGGEQKKILSASSSFSRYFNCLVLTLEESSERDIYARKHTHTQSRES